MPPEGEKEAALQFPLYFKHKIIKFQGKQFEVSFSSTKKKAGSKPTLQVVLEEICHYQCCVVILPAYFLQCIHKVASWHCSPLQLLRKALLVSWSSKTSWISGCKNKPSSSVSKMTHGPGKLKYTIQPINVYSYLWHKFCCSIT